MNDDNEDIIMEEQLDSTAHFENISDRVSFNNREMLFGMRQHSENDIDKML